jgi:Spy/CpxP family protein refolding chaperone
MQAAMKRPASSPGRRREKMKTRILLVTLAAASLLTLTAWYGGCGHHGPMDADRVNGFVTDRLDDFLDDLDATPQQRTQVMALKDRLVPEGVELGKSMRQARREAFDILKTDTPDATRLHGLVDQRVDAFRGFAHKVADALLEFKRILTPEQRQKIQNRVQKHMDRYDG